jgi:2-iminobutanoate/2-iminopropanoate deaminase
MRKHVIHTDKVPPARVPLSQAIKVGDWIFASGQLGNDPRTGRLAEGGIAAETRQVCENLKAILDRGIVARPGGEGDHLHGRSR